MHFLDRNTADLIESGFKYRLRLLALALGFLPMLSLAQGWKVPKPTPGLMPDPAAGKPLFEKNCAACHGADMRGTNKGPPILSRLYSPSHHADVAFQLAARNGVRAHHWKFGDMAPVPSVTPDDIAHITAHVRDVQRRSGIR